MPSRKPLAPAASRRPADPPRTVKRDQKIEFRVSEQEKAEAAGAAILEYGYFGLSRYVRDCFFIGHSMKQANTRLKVTSV